MGADAIGGCGSGSRGSRRWRGSSGCGRARPRGRSAVTVTVCPAMAGRRGAGVSVTRSAATHGGGGSPVTATVTIGGVAESMAVSIAGATAVSMAMTDDRRGRGGSGERRWRRWGGRACGSGAPAGVGLLLKLSRRAIAVRPSTPGRSLAARGLSRRGAVAVAERRRHAEAGPAERRQQNRSADQLPWDVPRGGLPRGRMPALGKRPSNTFPTEHRPC